MGTSTNTDAHIITAAPAGPTRDRLEASLSDRGARVISLHRETAVSEQRLVLDADGRLLWDGQDVLAGATAALVLDSGYMWSVPLCEPTPGQWEDHYQRFDDYLRDDRETASLWYSTLAIMEDRVPRCFNRAGAFANEAMKHDALELLRAADLPVAPALTTNDPDAVDSFARQHAGPLLELSLVPGAAARVLPREELGGLELDRRPVMLLALARPDLTRVTVAGGDLVAQSPADALPSPVPQFLPAAMEALQMEWGELVLGQGEQGWCLCDFSPSPDLGALDREDAERVLDAVWGMLR